MARSRRIPILLAAVGCLLLAGAVAMYARASQHTSQLSERTRETHARLDSTSAELRKTSLLYQGLSQSVVPDSLKSQMAGEMWRLSLSYSNRIAYLEMRERDLRLRVAKLKKQEEAARKKSVVDAAPLAGAGVATLLAGVVGMVRTRRRALAA